MITFKHITTPLAVLFLSVSITTRVLLLCLFAMVSLFAFTVLLDAIAEISQHIAQVYSSSDALTRLVIFILAIIFCKRVFPYAARIFKGV